MSSHTKLPVVDGAGKRVFWRSLEERARQEQAAETGSDIVGATVDAEELGRLNRRKFMTLSGAVATLASVEGCIRRPVEKIMPYAAAPEGVTPGVPNHYATVMDRRGEALGLLVDSYEGRPTKIEGNPAHPSSGGATDILAQASVLDLYDPDRARQPSKSGEAKTYPEVDDLLKQVADGALKNGGRGLRVLAEPSNSPTFLRLRDALTRRFPEAKVHTWAPVNQAAQLAATRIAFGRPLNVLPQYEQARVVLALDCDFLMTEQGCVAAARGFAQSRRMASAEGSMSRLYAVEPTLTVTGSNADHRQRLPARQIGTYLRLLAAELATTHGVQLGPIEGAARGVSLEGLPPQWVKVVAKELAEHRRESLIVVGSGQPAGVHALAIALNRALGNAGATVAYTDAVDAATTDPYEDVKALTADIASGRVDTLLILGGNPVHDAPADLGFGQALEKVANTICVSSYRHETAQAVTWHVTRAHELETWGDQQSLRGHYSVQQPLIAPLWGGRSDIEILGYLAGEPNWRGHYLVRATATQRGFGGELGWRKLVQKGVSDLPIGTVYGGQPVDEGQIASAVAALAKPAAPNVQDLEVVFTPDNRLFDGRHANNTWLLETPDPITRIVWDNAALLSPATARALGVENRDMVRLTRGDKSIDIVAWVQAGQADYSIALALGWGRKQAGSNADGTGFDVYPLRTTTAPAFAGGVTLQKLGTRYKISQTQEHDSMEGRPVIVDATLDEYRETPNYGQFASPDPSVPPLWKTVDYSQGHQWGMVIDLNACIGCNACAVACQSENNIPVVGKDQVARGREMSWIRIDRYYSGDENDPEVAFQPLACQQCEEAPCENVCPVAATSHSPEGLNDIAYNRCIGTRYCMNNCPYKVRRFNFLNFNLEIAESRKMQYNPNVSLRFRGVIEKCSYCTQRVQGAKIAARREGRALKDGDIVTACQQACPAQAIVFGDINDPDSAVSKQRATDRQYALLADVGTRPRTRFLGKVRNPNPEMQG